MTRSIRCHAVLFTLALAGGSAGESGKLLRVHFGPLWPRELLHSNKPTQWDLGITYGLMIDGKIGLGVGVDFMWNHVVKEKRDPTDPTRVAVTWREGSYMFPVYGSVTIDPFSGLVVHPALSFDLGYSSMVYNVDNEEELVSGVEPDRDPDGYYFGWFMRPALAALVNLGKNAALCLGVDYQWANTRSAKTDGNIYRRRNMTGAGVKGGLRVVF